MTNRTNNLTDTDNTNLSQRNRGIASRQRYEGRSRHSTFWTSDRLLLDRLYAWVIEGDDIAQPKPSAGHVAFRYTGFEAGAL